MADVNKEFLDAVNEKICEAFGVPKYLIEPDAISRDKIWRASLFGEPFHVAPSCNSCVWVNVTEEEQDALEATGVHVPGHMCMCYMERVKHETNNLVHNNIIIPCKKCKDDDHRAYKSRDREG